MQTIEYTIPDYALSYLINGDSSSLDEREIKELDEFCQNTLERLGNALFIYEEDLGFQESNDINKIGSDCATCYILTDKEGV